MNLLITIISCLVTAVIFFFLGRKSAMRSAEKDAAKDSTCEAYREGPTIEEKPEEVIPVEETQEEEPVAEEETRDVEPVTQNKELVASLHKLLEEDKVYLHPDIRIDDVARMIYTNRTYITRLMRQEYGLTFIEYVNVARIQHSQHLLYSYNMTLEEVAIKSGFQSTSSYCRAFKRLIGIPPLAWIDQVKRPEGE